ncbi:MAG: histidine kinase [Firmicutes bacterium]|nr:histidine kinase [Bacillota bacterium]
MQNYCGLALEEIVNIDILQEIQDKFCKATGLAAIIVDVAGKPVTLPSEFTEFCKYVRSTSIGLVRCMDCDDRGGRTATENHQPVVYNCHLGLTDLAAPIIVNDEYLGAFLAGQVVMATDGHDARIETRRRWIEAGFDPKVHMEVFDIVEVVPPERVKAGADLLYIMSNYIVEMGIANISQRQLLAEMKAKAELETLLKANELKALQSQVNPHFLFNTLNTIARLAMLEGAERTQEMVFALSDLLRNNLRNIDQSNTLAEEISSIKNYLLIQQVRFGDRVKAEINIPADLEKMGIPVMTLQPLVENSIIHGLEPKKEGGNIQITAKVEADKLLIIIADTGVGIKPEKILGIFGDEKRTACKGQTTGLGIINVHKRLQNHFGNEYGIKIDAQPGLGTIVKIYLPLARY